MYNWITWKERARGARQMPIHPLVDFQGKTVVVSGASSGIGRAIALMLGKYGAKLILTGRDAKRLEETSRNLGSVEHRVVPMDLAQQETILPTLKKVVKEFGLVYGLCHAAGNVETLPLSATAADRVRSMIEVNLLAGLELARVLCRRDVMDPEGGSVLFISSIYAIVGKPGQIGYSAAKGAVTSAARAMAVELARRKIRVNVLSPGLVHTEMTRKVMEVLTEQQVKEIENAHLLGTGTPDDVARAAVFLLAPQSSWITGTDFVIDGGYTAR
jgi:NAD(P)-dependent dehydrogenase (short-subunit alcohol dehydrogenase family)